MNLSSIDVILAISELDSALEQSANHYVLYTCGGASLIYLGYDDRRTGDVDIINEDLSDELKQASFEVAKKLQIGQDWLNNQVHPLGKRLGKDWKLKCQCVYQGKAITLKSISRQDLINSKFHATIERTGKDYTDILWLKPTLEELETARNYALKLGATENYPIFVTGYFNEIKKDLGL
jgi:hypothetical protein